MGDTGKVNALKKVMFVDDDFYVNEFHKMLVKKTGMADEAIFHTNANEALQDLKELGKDTFPELILIDVNMPEMDGHEFVKKLNSLDSFEASVTTVAFLTASKDMRDVIKADENNVEFYYWKPLNQEGVEKILRDCGKTL